MKSKILEQERISKGFIKVERVLLETPVINGTDSFTQVREVANQASSVFVLPFDKRTGEYLTVVQHRAGAIYESTTLVVEPIAGRIDKDKTPSEIAVAELSEEAGLTCSVTDLIPLGEMMISPGASTEKGHFFLLPCDLSSVHGNTKHGLQSEGEDILLLKQALDADHDKGEYLVSLQLGFLKAMIPAFMQ
ncbi:NUDIX domain-containing protein [Vibrio splendidus]|nr:NUDIX hydrolase [Vibrio splendidus]MCC4880499.1 NUDIX hydrolase [Vibrio splendidus]